MAIRGGSTLVLAILTFGASAASANAATIVKGGGIITARSAACGVTYAVGDGFVMEYRPNFSTNPLAGAAETVTITSGDTTLLLTSTDLVTKLVGPGTATIVSSAYGKGMPTLASTITAIASTPLSITTATPLAGLIGVNITNFGIAGCTVSFTAGVAKITSPF